MAETAAGAVAFSRPGDPATGEFEDAVVLRQFGEVLSLDDLVSSDGRLTQSPQRATQIAPRFDIAR